MHHATNAVAAVIANDRTPFLACELHDRRAHVTESRTGAHHRDPRIAGPSCDVDEVPGVARGLSDLSDYERRRCVAMKPIDLGRDIDVDDVARLESLRCARDPVTHDVIATRANCRRKSLVSELARDAPPRPGVVANPMIDLRRRDADRNSLRDDGQGLGRDASRATKPFELGATEDFHLHAASGLVDRPSRGQYLLDMPLGPRATLCSWAR